MILKIRNKKYEAMGFVEALIAIMIVGAASVVLMDIAVRTMQDVIQNETIDTMTQFAVEGAEMAQEIAKKEIDLGDENIFPSALGCYRLIDSSEGGYQFARTGAEGPLVMCTDDRTCYDDFYISEENTDYFRTLCIEDLNEGYIVSYVIVGLTAGDGDITKGNLVSDYKYLTIIDL